MNRSNNELFPRAGGSPAQRNDRANLPHLRTFRPLYERAETGHFAAVAGPAGKRGIAALGKVFWPLLTMALAAGIAWEVYAGVAYHKTNGPSARARHPGLFWFEIAFQIMVALLCAGVAVRALRTPKA